MDNSVKTKLLTLLNVSATKVSKHKRTYEDFLGPSDKLNKRKPVSFAEPRLEPSENEDILLNPDAELAIIESAAQEEAEVVDNEQDQSMWVQNVHYRDPVKKCADPSNSYEKHFGNNSVILTDSVRNDVDGRLWMTNSENLGTLGPAVISVPQSSEAISSSASLPTPDVSGFSALLRIFFIIGRFLVH